MGLEMHDACYEVSLVPIINSLIKKVQNNKKLGELS